MIIGLTGEYASGKDSAAQILKEMNFQIISFSEIIKEELQERKQKITRENLIKAGDQLRARWGPEILARKALEKIRDGENYVFTSIRNVAEVDLLQEREDFLLVRVTAPEQTRLQRVLQRNLNEDPKTLRELHQQEALENSKESHGQQLKKVIDMAGVTIANNSTFEKLREKVGKLIQDRMFTLQNPRPDWDHYFMNIAEQVKMRCNCMSAKKGAIIVRDKQILSTGYNGTPKRIKHCTQGACLRCTARHLGKIKSGVYSEPCICAHSEENAIVQAAYNGTSTKGAVMYTTFTPCTNCAKLIINAGIIEVIAKVKYPDDVGTGLLKEAGVQLRVLD